MPVFQSVLLHAVSQANERGYQVMPIPVPHLENDDVANFAARIFGDVEIAGVVCEWFADSKLVGNWLSKAGVPMVWYSTSGVVSDISHRAVSIREEPGVKELLVDLTARDSVVLLKGPGPNRPRYDVARQQFPDLIEMDIAGWSQADGSAAWAHLSDLSNPLVICPNDPVALGVMSAAVHSGRQVPHDLGITGFGDSPASRLAMTNLSTVRWPIMELGETLITEMTALLGNAPASLEPVVLQTSSLRRGSA